MSELFELRSVSMTLVAFVLRSVDLDRVEASLESRLGPTPELFSDDAVMLDLSQVEAAAGEINFARLIGSLRRYRMLPVAVRGGNPAQMAAALGAGLAQAPSAASILPARETPTSRPDARVDAVAAVPAIVPAAAAPETALADAPAGGATEAAPPIQSLHVALVVDRPLRSGQQVYARGGDLVVLAAVNFGAEVIADGSIHVYAPLRGKAIAGAKGNTSARIFSTCLDAELVAIAGTYRTTENPLPSEVAGKAAQIRLDGERLVFEPLA